MAIPMLKIRRPNGRLIFNMEIAILDKTVFNSAAAQKFHKKYQMPYFECQAQCNLHNDI